ncbi:type II toxin-antitoxin system YhaV family toxin [Photorhabdus australis]|uniref:type II toxin-antitoxin system YhaV family toxin n=1 Tax=Photorhabdus australis TaxID=286156 RepID=UPI0005684B3E|nr:type II toxin-antitoxin system YhaV family toxin [Photorhabdus australis]
MQRHGWTLLYHSCVIQQLQKLHDAVKRAEKSASDKFESNANVKLFRALSKLILDVVPSDPSRDEYRQGNTLGPTYRHWRRAKIGRRFRLFFRYDSKAKVIVYAWVNDEETLRSEGSKSDPYAIFEKMLGRGNPPDDWATLIAASRSGHNRSNSEIEGNKDVM